MMISEMQKKATAWKWNINEVYKTILDIFICGGVLSPYDPPALAHEFLFK